MDATKYIISLASRSIIRDGISENWYYQMTRQVGFFNKYLISVSNVVLVALLGMRCGSVVRHCGTAQDLGLTTSGYTKVPLRTPHRPAQSPWGFKPEVSDGLSGQLAMSISLVPTKGRKDNRWFFGLLGMQHTQSINGHRNVSEHLGPLLNRMSQ